MSPESHTVDLVFFLCVDYIPPRLPPQEEAHVNASGCRSRNMDRLVELLNSMRSNSTGVERQLTSFMEEAQCSARSEESLTQVVSTIYATAVSDRSFAATAATLCDRMALFMVEGTKFRSLLLNMLQVRTSVLLQSLVGIKVQFTSSPAGDIHFYLWLLVL